MDDFVGKRLFQFEHSENMPHHLVASETEFSRFFVENSLLVLMDNSITPIVELNKLAGLTWKLIGSNVVPVAIGKNLPSIFMCIEANADKRAAVMVIPNDLKEKCNQVNPQYFLGGLVYNSSKAVDYYHDKFFDVQSMEDRAMAYEAEFLLFMQSLDFKQAKKQHNDYQKQVLEKFPEGLKSLPSELKYEHKEFDPATPVSPFFVAPRSPENN